MKFILTSILLWLISTAGTAAFDWHLIPTGLSVDLQGMHFIHENEGYLVAKSGDIFRFSRISDGWHIDTISGNIALEEIYPLGPGTTVAVGSKGTIIQNFRFGKQRRTVNMDENINFNDLIFYDTLIGIIVGTNYKRDLGLPGVVYRTTDGGLSYDSLEIKDRRLNCIDLSPEGKIIIAGRQFVFISDDKGQTWSQYQNPPKSKPTGVAISGERAMMVGMGGFLAISNNSGRDWEAKELISRRISMFDITMIDSLKALAVASEGLILYTDDGGQNWIPEYSGAVSDLLDIQLVGNTIYACGKKGVLVYAKFKDEPESD